MKDEHMKAFNGSKSTIINKCKANKTYMNNYWKLGLQQMQEFPLFLLQVQDDAQDWASSFHPF